MSIPGQGASSTSLTQYKAAVIPGELLVKAVPEIERFAIVKVEQIANLNSADITFETGL